jgi:uncharacterized DUF497 family protein
MMFAILKNKYFQPQPSSDSVPSRLRPGVLQINILTISILPLYTLCMIKPKKILASCTGFDWDQGNFTKNWESHEVSTSECEQIFFNKLIIVKRDREHSKIENRYYALGQTNMNRLLFAVFALRNQKIRIISARDMTDTEMERYLK